MAQPDRSDEIRELLSRRILVLDGAMGTQIQTYGLDEAAFRGERFASHPRDLKGASDVLAITNPGILDAVHRQYLEAGADIIETNTFNAQAISFADYDLQPFVYEINKAADIAIETPQPAPETAFRNVFSPDVDPTDRQLFDTEDGAELSGFDGQCVH